MLSQSIKVRHQIRINRAYGLKRQWPVGRCIIDNDRTDDERIAELQRLMANLQAAARVRKLLMELEADPRLAPLNSNERDALYAAADATQHPGDKVSANQISSHTATAEQSHATLARALEGLLEKGYLVRPEGTKRGSYIVTEGPQAATETGSTTTANGGASA